MQHGQIASDRDQITAVQALRPVETDRRFGRLFSAAQRAPSDLSLAWLGRPGGTTEAQPAQPNRDNRQVPAGFTFLGQFIDHDITLTVGSSAIGAPDALHTLRNERHPSLNLDSVYGVGPDRSGSGRLYDNYAFRLPESLSDLPRGGRVGVRGDRDVRPAIIGDARNDENVILAQLHLAFLRLHNKLLQEIGATDRDSFERVRQKIIHTYQHIVLDEYLPLHVPADVLNFIRQDGLGRYTDLVVNNSDRLAMPVEFSVAAFRFGHSQVRGGYQINNDRNAGRPFGAVLFGAGDNDLNGGVERPFAESVDFSLFFGADPTAVANSSLAVDGLLSSPLFTLRSPAISDPPLSLAERNLRRGRDQRLASGQTVARALIAAGVPGVRELTDAELNLPPEVDLPGVVNPGAVEADDAPPSVREATPLWFYILREAEVQFNGQPEATRGTPALGPIGGALVAEVLVGLLRHDDGQHHSANLAPVVPIDIRVGADNTALIDERFDTMAKLTEFAGVKVEGAL